MPIDTERMTPEQKEALSRMMSGQLGLVSPLAQLRFSSSARPADLMANIPLPKPGVAGPFRTPQEEQIANQKYREASLSSATPEQYNAILKDPKYADLWKYGGVTRPSAYTQESLDKMRNPLANNPYLGPNAPFAIGAGSDIAKNIQKMVAGAQKTPEELRVEYENLLRNPVTSSQILYNKYYTDQNAPKFGTDVVGGTHFGGKYEAGNPFNLEAGSTHAAQQKVYSSTPYAAIRDMGIDPNNPYAEQLLRAQMDKFMKENPDNIITRAMNSKSFGREDAPSAGFVALQQKYPKASYVDLVDMTLRGIYGQNALPPRGMPGWLDTLIATGLNFIPVVGNAASLAYTTGRSLSEGDPLWATALKAYGQYGLNNVASNLVTLGPSAYLSNMANSAADWLANPTASAGTAASEAFQPSHLIGTGMDITTSLPEDWWNPNKPRKAEGGYINEDGELADILSKEQYQPDGYAEGGDVDTDISRLTRMLREGRGFVEDRPIEQSRNETLGDMMRRLGLDENEAIVRAIAEPSIEVRPTLDAIQVMQMPHESPRNARIMSESRRLGLNIDGVEPYAIIDPVHRMAQQYGVTLKKDLPGMTAFVDKGYAPEADMDILVAGLAKELNDRARLQAMFNRIEGPHGGDIGGMLTYSKEF